MTPTIMRCMYGLHDGTADGNAISFVKLGHLGRAAAPRRRCAPAWNDDRALSAEPSQRAMVQVITVGMGDQDGV
jgi:hypothetical protein